jgi:hypothetical protein
VRGATVWEVKHNAERIFRNTSHFKVYATGLVSRGGPGRYHVPSHSAFRFYCVLLLPQGFGSGF